MSLELNILKGVAQEIIETPIGKKITENALSAAEKLLHDSMPKSMVSAFEKIEKAIDETPVGVESARLEKSLLDDEPQRIKSVAQNVHESEKSSIGVDNAGDAPLVITKDGGEYTNHEYFAMRLGYDPSTPRHVIDAELVEEWREQEAFTHEHEHDLLSLHKFMEDSHGEALGEHEVYKRDAHRAEIEDAHEQALKIDHQKMFPDKDVESGTPPEFKTGKSFVDESSNSKMPKTRGAFDDLPRTTEYWRLRTPEPSVAEGEWELAATPSYLSSSLTDEVQKLLNSNQMQLLEPISDSERSYASAALKQHGLSRASRPKSGSTLYLNRSEKGLIADDPVTGPYIR